MTTIRRINVSQVEGDNANNNNTNELRPFGETAFYLDNNKLTLMMFDGTRTHLKSKVLSQGVLYGSNADSGDGGGYDTIKLIPDADLGTDQYIVVDPTGGEPGHIHLRAGGTQDASGADLYLGGELTNVRVSDSSDDVRIRTSIVGEGEINYDWTFDNNGKFTAPGEVYGQYFSLRGGNAEGTIGTLGYGGDIVWLSGNEGVNINVDGEGGPFWQFGANGTITFPDNTIQTTAYIAGTAISKFVLINVDGGVFGSDDGENWDGPFDTEIDGLNRVAVGPDKIVYLGGGEGQSTNIYYASAWNVTPTMVDAPGVNTVWDQVRYFTNIERFVVVGSIDGTPTYLHSADGVSWTAVSVDNTWASTLDGGGGYGAASFTDVATNGTGFLLITENTILGSFYTTALTSIESVGSSEWLNDGMSFEEVVYSTSGVFTGWFAFGDGNTGADDGWWFNESFNPAMTSFSVFAINDISLAFQEHIGYEPDWSELTIGLYDGTSTVVIATTHGQILYWPAVPAGPFVSIPKPYTVTLDNFAQSATSYIDIGGGIGYEAIGEKFTITGSSVAGYNGTYYIDGSYFVFTDAELTIPFDTSGLDPFTGTATLTWSHGMYIDALNYANGKFYVSNDSEEVFVSSDGGATWTEVASLSNSPGEGGEEGVPGTAYMNDIDGYVGTTGITTSRLINGSQTLQLNSNGTLIFPDSTTQTTAFTGTGDITFSGDSVFGTQGRVTFGDAENTLAVVSDSIPVKIQINDINDDPSKVWLFGVDGSMSLPLGGTISNGDIDGLLLATDSGTSVIALYGENNEAPGVFIGSIGGLLIQAGGNPMWNFKSDSTLTFPDSTVQSTAWTGFTANAANWSGTAPATLDEAVDRLAILLKTLNSGTGA